MRALPVLTCRLTCWCAKDYCSHIFCEVEEKYVNEKEGTEGKNIKREGIVEGDADKGVEDGVEECAEVSVEGGC